MANPVATLWRIPETRQKIVFTLVCLLVYRVGAHITAPWINVPALRAYAGQLQGTAFGIYDMFVGGGLSRATVFALGIMPYISASIMFQLLAAVVPSIEKMQKEGEDGRKKLTQYTRYATLVLALFQAYGFARFIETQVPAAVTRPGIPFQLVMMLTLVTGAMFIMWLGEQITERGIGNGMSLLIFFGIVEALPSALYETGRLVYLGQVGAFSIVILIVMMLLTIAGTVAVTMAARKIPVQIPQKVMGRGRIRQGQKSFIPLRINMAGVMPIIFAQSIMILPATAAQFTNTGWLRTFSQWFAINTVPYFIAFTVLIVFFTYFYTAIIYNPVDIAENLKKQGAFVPGVKPGARTAEYIDRVMSRISLPGALFLALIALVPSALLEAMGIQGLNRVLGGTGLLITVGVALDTVQQMQQHLLLRRYDGFMKKGRIKFRGRQQRYI
ncbi:preprotein translocase subunit SecY [Longimicrobium terrae]|uniref:Protein translocase subunit SecY n=1 Tax=Longimicrobium terrae TaxID=1639882 RepID=A0A841GP13_9BACT|nr:preprotein translocase subunit SecY [Longimicrobium terrae]MBB4634470.1 preprotein translocase subunit SecY [Longimicrobium terrae]MBB6068640.1 preprotein translocase subunit SecY [Longimicrobium terrae]NNC27826.1 preprotein translocase subunit SecY [Longimicrobium terrae]